MKSECCEEVEQRRGGVEICRLGDCEHRRSLVWKFGGSSWRSRYFVRHRLDYCNAVCFPATACRQYIPAVLCRLMFFGLISLLTYNLNGTPARSRDKPQRLSFPSISRELATIKTATLPDELTSDSSWSPIY